MKAVAIAGGRFSAVTRGHELLIRTLEQHAKRLKLRPYVFVVDGEKSGGDIKKNPLSADHRKQLLEDLFPNVTIDIVSSAYEIIETLDVQGLYPGVWIAGSDRINQYKKMLAYAGLPNTLIAIDRATTGMNISATMARKAAAENNYEAFSSMMPDQMNERQRRELMALIFERMRGS